MVGNVHSIQTLGTVDGPGVRCVVFLQGCPLRCAYCHNPDTWEKDGGTPMSDDDVLKRILRVKPYFGTDGGVTLSGGEPLLQPQFAKEILKRCKENGIHTALDTSGCILNEETKEVANLADLILLDVKFKTESLYQKYTGGSLDTVLKFLQYANSKNKPVWIRQVILPGINDTKDDVLELCERLKPYGCIKKLELLPFHKLCLEKYQQLGIEFAFQNLPEADHSQVANLQTFANECLFHNC